MKEDKKILLVIHELTYSGSPRSTLNMAIVLRNIYSTVEIWALEDGGFKEELSNYGFDVKIVDEPLAFIPLEERLKAFDLVIANTIFCYEFAYMAQAYVKTILYIREAKNISEIIKNHNINASLIRKINYIICISDYAYHYIRQYHEKSGLYVVYNYVEDKKWKLRLHRPRFEIFMLMAGTLEYRKGFDVVLQAFEMLENKKKDRIKLFVMGREVLWDKEYGQYIIEHPDSIYLGEIKDEKAKYQLYSKMHFIIIPSRDEACSLVALESAMLGKSLIISDNVGAKYLVNNKNGYIYTTEKPIELANIFEKILQDDFLKLHCKIKGYYSRKKYIKYGTKKKYQSCLREVLSEILMV